MDTLFQDVRFAVRTLAKNPGFAALTILCLALGVGVNSTIFSIVSPKGFRASLAWRSCRKTCALG